MILIATLAFALSTPPTTIHPTNHHRRGAATMAQGTNTPPGGGKNRTNKGRAGELTPRLSYPERHPNIPFRGARNRIGMDANHPVIEHTQRPGQLR